MTYQEVIDDVIFIDNDQQIIKVSSVLINEEGFAEKFNQHKHNVEILFIRDDGWTLGTSKKLEMAAEKLWSDHWIAYYENGKVHPYLQA